MRYLRMLTNALVGGLIFMAFPAVQGHVSAGHVNPLSNYALPVLTLCLYRIILGWGGIRTALVGAVAMWVLALGNFTFPAFALLPLVLFGSGYLLLFRRGLLRRSPRTLLRNLADVAGDESRVHVVSGGIPRRNDERNGQRWRKPALAGASA